ncbi:MAG: hypothetical protein HHAS10_10040 [Candidatus Altimarinota bacterium]
MKDFFTRYRESHKNPILIPAIFGLTLSFAVVANMRGTDIDLKSISANVVTGLEQETKYPADFVVEKNDDGLKFIIGKNAENVKSIHFSVLGNPTSFTKAESSDARTTISMNEPGVALIQVAVNQSLKAGDTITTIRPVLNGDTPLTVIDAGFSSESGEYSLSVKSE